ncbi:MAG: YkgJ family cysteine cluster protein [Eubacterium sp.]|nr:YkgJ family cysteine cluster protein [Eubacterium sp.]
MLRYEDIKDFSDGRLYELNDMVKADCQDCRNCHKCCSSDMGKSITLDPLDIFRLTQATGRAFTEMLGREIELSYIDGIIIPNMLMGEYTVEVGATGTGSEQQTIDDETGTGGEQQTIDDETGTGSEQRTISGEAGTENVIKKEGCRFLNDAGRCSIHPYRPGICRLFPLGRIYEGRTFKYFLQVNECSKKNRTKVKVSKWIDTEDIEKYTAFVTKWHNFLKLVAKKGAEAGDETKAKEIFMFVINTFYVVPYEKNMEGTDFYKQFDLRLKTAIQYL